MKTEYKKMDRAALWQVRHTPKKDLKLLHKGEIVSVPPMEGPPLSLAFFPPVEYGDWIPDPLVITRLACEGFGIYIGPEKDDRIAVKVTRPAHYTRGTCVAIGAKTSRRDVDEEVWILRNIRRAALKLAETEGISIVYLVGASKGEIL